MRFKAEDEVAKKVQAVFINNKRVAMPVELDTDQGWVDVLVPVVPQSSVDIRDRSVAAKVEDTSEPANFEYKRVRLNGSVHVVWSK